MNISKILFIILIILSLLIIIPIIYFVGYFLYKYIHYSDDVFFSFKLNSYVAEGWIMITGPTSGIGLAIINEICYRINHLNAKSVTEARVYPKFCLIGRNLDNTISILSEKYAESQFKAVEVDFSDSQNPDFFTEIENWLQDHKVTLLINNIGHRAITRDFAEQNQSEIIETINCGTMPQIRLTQLIMKQYEQHPETDVCIVNITAQCFTYNTGLGVMWKPTISVPYLAVYEATNAFGYYLAESIYSEIKLLREKAKVNVELTNNNKIKYENFKFLNITPGAVITDKTRNALSWIPFSCSDTEFANGIINLINRKGLEGQQCANWKHELSNLLMFFAPFLKSIILTKVGTKFAL